MVRGTGIAAALPKLGKEDPDTPTCMSLSLCPAVPDVEFVSATLWLSFL